MPTVLLHLCGLNPWNYKYIYYLFQIIISVNVPRPFGIALFEDTIYWTDKLNKGVYSANKYNGSGREVIASQLDNVMDIKMFYKPQPRGKYNQIFH